MTMIPFEGLSILGNRMLARCAISAIRADVRETKENFIVEAELPGVKKDNVAIVCQENVLTISVKAEENAGAGEEPIYTASDSRGMLRAALRSAISMKRVFPRRWRTAC